MAASEAGSRSSSGPSAASLAELRSALSDCFSSGPRHRSFVACLQGLALADRGSSLPPKPASEAAIASGSLQAGALQVTHLRFLGLRMFKSVDPRTP